MPKLSLFDFKTNKLIGTYNTNKLTGKFIMIIKPGQEYIMKIESEGYISSVRKINPSSSEEISKIKLQKMEK